MVSSFQIGPTHLLGQSINSQIWGNQGETVTQDFDVPGPPASYFPGETNYGMPADNYHSGLDIGMPSQTPIYAPRAGRIVCAGTNDGFGVNGAGCAAYQSDNQGATSGRLELEYAPGQSILFGHVFDSSVLPGTDVQAGALIGHSGSAGSGPHIHLEERIPASLAGTVTTSGTQLVSPANLFAGGESGVNTGANVDYGAVLQAAGPFLRRIGLFVIGLGALVIMVHNIRSSGAPASGGHHIARKLAKVAAL